MQKVKKIIGYNEETGEPIFEQEEEQTILSNQIETIVPPTNIIGYNPNTGEPIYESIPPKKSKKGLIIALIVILAVIIIGGISTWLIVSNNSSKESSEISNNKKNNNNNGKQNNNEWEQYYEYSEEELKDGTYNGNITNKSNIDSTVIVDKKDIRIVAKRIRYKYDNAKIMIIIENNSKNDIIVDSEDFSINGIVVDGFTYTTVSSGKKALASISIKEDDLVKANITSINTIEFDLIIRNADSVGSKLFTVDNIELKTDSTLDEQPLYNKEENLIVDQNNVKIYATGINNEIDEVWGRKIYYYIENNNDFDISIRFDKCKVNGVDIGYGVSISANIPANKKIYTFGYISDYYIEKYNIPEIENFEAVFNVNKNDKLLFKTDAISLSYDK